MHESIMGNVPPPEDTVDVCELHRTHPDISAEDWRCPLILRLLGSRDYSDGQRTMSDSFRDEHGTVQLQQIALRWKGLRDDFVRRLKTYQDSVLTEYATLGLACILLSRHTHLAITEVTQRGDRADYWLGARALMLEVSGRQNGDLDALRDEKRDQLLENPHDMNGYVCVAVYASHESCLWYYSNGHAADGS